jgi:BirA family biotin operon repressor/biotin-[acetyl-CoA-carboxylase] ligase
MYIIKLNATDSTNSYLKAICLKRTPKDFTVAVANEQKKGRGQMGTIWQAETSKNLTFSVFKELSFLSIEQQFYLSMAVSLALIKALNELQIPKLKIKWPNDILAENKKIAGILIENTIKNSRLVGSIIGVGLNVNQKIFDNLPEASSLSVLTGRIYDKDEILLCILNHLAQSFKQLEDSDFESIKNEYEDLLFRIKKPSTFKTAKGRTFSGFIEGVSEDGKLEIRLEDHILKTFGLKEVKLLY